MENWIAKKKDWKVIIIKRCYTCPFAFHTPCVHSYCTYYSTRNKNIPDYDIPDWCELPKWSSNTTLNPTAKVAG